MNQNEHLYEFYGILMGDGCISRYYSCNHLHHELRIDGNAITDVDYYYNYVVPLITKITGRVPKPRFRKDCKGMYITFQDKGFALFLHTYLEFPIGKKGNIIIKNEVLQDFEKLKHVLRGLFDTDGCIYFTKNNSEERYYPILEITSYSFDLITQLKSALTLAGFKVKISHYQDSIKLHGKENLFKWMELIGTSHPDKRSKFDFWRKYGYCPKIDELGYKERLDALGL